MLLATWRRYRMTRLSTLLIAGVGLVLAGSASAQFGGRAPRGPAPGAPGILDKVPAARCPVSNKAIKDKAAGVRVPVNDLKLLLCSEQCVEPFRKEPSKYLRRIEDPITGIYFKLKPDTPRLERDGVIYLFKTPETKAQFEANPEKWLRILRKEGPQ
jgi:YHS domain-containing protein